MKTIFKGEVNGTRYDDINKYNQAIQEILKSGGVLNTSSTVTTVDDDQSEEVDMESITASDIKDEYEKCKNKCDDCKCNSVDKKDLTDKFDDTIKLYLTMVNLNDLEGTEKDVELVKEIQEEYTAEHGKTDAAVVKNNYTDRCQKDFVNNVLNIIDVLNDDYTKNQRVRDIISKKLSNNSDLIEKLQNDLKDAEVTREELLKKATILTHAKSILEAEKQYFSSMIKPVVSTQTPSNLTTSVREEKPQKESDSYEVLINSFNGLQKLLNELF